MLCISRGMKLDVNNDVNPGTKSRLGIDGRRSVKNTPPPPNSHSSNPIHKATMAPQSLKPASRPTTQLPSDEVGKNAETISEKTPQHEINKTVVIVAGPLST